MGGPSEPLIVPVCVWATRDSSSVWAGMSSPRRGPFLVKESSIPGIDLLEPNLNPTQKRPGVPAFQASSSVPAVSGVWVTRVLSCLQGTHSSIGSLVRFALLDLTFSSFFQHHILCF